jgi:hypothetical protein
LIIRTLNCFGCAQYHKSTCCGATSGQSLTSPSYQSQKHESFSLILEICYIVSLIALLLTVFGKGILHVYLDSKNGRKIEYARSRGYVYLLPYEKEISPELEKVKVVCNKFQKGMIYCLVIFLILFLLKQNK